MDNPFLLASFIVLTVATYLACRRLYLTVNHPLLNVVALSAGIVIAVLVACDLPYTVYAPARDVMTALLGPATVGLAVPLYRHRRLLRSHGLAIVASVGLGAFLAMLSAGLIASLGGLPREVVVSILPKGVSIPFAVEISRIYEGIPALSAAFVVATGTLGSLFGGWLLSRVGIGHPVARGLALGTVSHAQGTATALMEGEQQGAMAGLAMILAGIFTAGFAPLVVRLLGLL
ncbi:LrgA-associated membrane protein LrgB [Desulfovibrio sp. DV]|uniref:LrgB family protein n=1 Tax=Desulfovibrio sp. DV TaxID=1844708 RepID=UPI0009595EEB|nr:LrgB family protein [Desulfovibrio sp. DV]OLN28635.1 LrgA-associated membrane protein LrgB [Desulfovibrio sp. DV]